jgi:hypothetical protein
MNSFRSRVTQVSIGGRVIYDAFARPLPERPDSRDVIARLLREGELSSYTQSRDVTLTFNGQIWTLPPGGGTFTVTTGGKPVASTPRRSVGMRSRAAALAEAAFILNAQHW